MMLIHELNQWHFECLHPTLTPAKVIKYRTRFNDFIEEMWKSASEQDEPKLEVAQVENCEDKADRPSAVRVQLKLKASKTQQGSALVEAFQSACKRLCEGIFSSMLNRDLLQSLSLVTNYALIGIEPLSPMLKVSWTTIALAQAVTKEDHTFRMYYEPTSFWSEWSKGLFVALITIHDSHFEKTDEPANLERLKSICCTAMTIVQAATGFARNQVDAELCKKKELLEEDFVRHAKKFELYQADIERSDFSQIPSDMVITIQELMIDINIKVFDLMCVTHEVEIALLNLQNEQKWATTTAASMGLVGGVACGAGVYYSCALWACLTPAAITIAAGGLAYYHYTNVDMHRKERLRTKDQRTKLDNIRYHVKAFSVAMLYQHMHPKPSGNEDVELSETTPVGKQNSPSSTSTAVTSPSLDLPECHRKELEGLFERFSQMGHEGITQAKWFKAIATEEGQLIVNSFKTLRNDPDFKARWNLPDEEQPPTNAEEEFKSEKIGRAAEENRRVEEMVRL